MLIQKNQRISMTLIEEIDIIKKKIDLREWVLEELTIFESKYGMTTKEFKEKWVSNEIPEPEDHKLLEEFLEWEGLSESLQNVENELKEIEKRIKES
ncbi:hypothetical protein LCGC14_1188030 [marine sediment metagenome]|uniref:Uncharacterized protein n=1 Tax=marine sediment metagenome TaxID=412755 RepID=A0A0F9LK85_9ZZZZ